MKPKTIKIWLTISAVTVLLASYIGLFVMLVIQAEKDNLPLNRILRNGCLTVTTRNNAHCYYEYRGQEMGFEYDLAKAFADYLGVGLKINVADNWESMIPDLLDEKSDLIAAGLTNTAKRRSRVAFSDGYMSVRQQIIVHRNHKGITRPADLSGKTIHIRKGTSYQDRLIELRRRGIDLAIQLYEDLPTEEFIRLVGRKEIDITIANDNIALLNRRYYPQAVVAGPLSDEEYLGWAVHPKSTKLLEKINSFFNSIRENGTFEKIYARYYANLDDFDYVDLQIYHNRLKSRLPKYRDIIQEAAVRNGFDWRLIAAQIYQESHFNPRAKSHAGAYGLMQLTLNTAGSYQVTDVYDPQQNIHAGVRHLKSLYDFFEPAEDDDRLRIAFAAYNIGQGHIQDARRLAAKLNLDPDKWASLEEVLPKLRYRKHYKHTRYGYCRGTEPISYVERIMMYYDILKHQGIEYETNTPVETRLREIHLTAPESVS